MLTFILFKGFFIGRNQDRLCNTRSSICIHNEQHPISRDDNTRITGNCDGPLSKEGPAFKNQRNTALVSVDSMCGTAEADQGMTWGSLTGPRTVVSSFSEIYSNLSLSLKSKLIYRFLTDNNYSLN